MDHREGHKGAAGAGKIHTDFERGFIRAEVINYKDLIELGCWLLPAKRVWFAPRARSM